MVKLLGVFLDQWKPWILMRPKCLLYQLVVGNYLSLAVICILLKGILFLQFNGGLEGPLILEIDRLGGGSVGYF